MANTLDEEDIENTGSSGAGPGGTTPPALKIDEGSTSSAPKTVPAIAGGSAAPPMPQVGGVAQISGTSPTTDNSQNSDSKNKQTYTPKVLDTYAANQQVLQNNVKQGLSTGQTQQLQGSVNTIQGATDANVQAANAVKGTSAATADSLVSKVLNPSNAADGLTQTTFQGTLTPAGLQQQTGESDTDYQERLRQLAPQIAEAPVNILTAYNNLTQAAASNDVTRQTQIAKAMDAYTKSYNDIDQQIINATTVATQAANQADSLSLNEALANKDAGVTGQSYLAGTGVANKGDALDSASYQTQLGLLRGLAAQNVNNYNDSASRQTSATTQANNQATADQSAIALARTQLLQKSTDQKTADLAKAAQQQTDANNIVSNAQNAATTGTNTYNWNINNDTTYDKNLSPTDFASAMSKGAAAEGANWSAVERNAYMDQLQTEAKARGIDPSNPASVQAYVTANSQYANAPIGDLATDITNYLNNPSSLTPEQVGALSAATTAAGYSLDPAGLSKIQNKIATDQQALAAQRQAAVVQTTPAPVPIAQQDSSANIQKVAEATGLDPNSPAAIDAGIAQTETTAINNAKDPSSFVDAIYQTYNLGGVPTSAKGPTAGSTLGEQNAISAQLSNYGLDASKYNLNTQQGMKSMTTDLYQKLTNSDPGLLKASTSDLLTHLAEAQSDLSLLSQPSGNANVDAAGSPEQWKAQGAVNGLTQLLQGSGMSPADINAAVTKINTPTSDADISAGYQQQLAKEAPVDVQKQADLNAAQVSSVFQGLPQFLGDAAYNSLIKASVSGLQDNLAVQDKNADYSFNGIKTQSIPQLAATYGQIQTSGTPEQLQQFTAAAKQLGVSVNDLTAIPSYRTTNVSGLSIPQIAAAYGALAKKADGVALARFTTAAQKVGVQPQDLTAFPQFKQALKG